MTLPVSYFKNIGVFQCHSDIISCIAFSPDCATALSGSHDGTTKLLNLATEQVIHSFRHEAPLKAVAFAKEGCHIVTFSDDKIVHIWDRISFDKIEDFPILGPKSEYKPGVLGHKYVLSAAFSPDGNYILLGCQDKIIYLLPVHHRSRSHRLIGHELPVFCVGFVEKNNLLYSFSQWPDSTLRVWDASSRKEIQRLRHKGHIMSVALSPDGHHAVAATMGIVFNKILVWDVLNGKNLFHLSPGFFVKETVSSLSFHQDNRRFISGSYEGIMRLWDIKTRRQLANVKAHDGAINLVVFSSNGHFILNSRF